MKAIGVRAEQKGRTHGRYRPALHDKLKSPCQQGAVHTWDEEHSEWTPALREFATAWRSQPKWVVSRTLQSVGPNASLVEGDLETAIRNLKARLSGEIAVSGPDLARSLTDLGLIDEYRLYLHPVVLGRGTPFFAGPRPPLRLVASDRIGDDAIRLTYVPA